MASPLERGLQRLFETHFCKLEGPDQYDRGYKPESVIEL
jgi:hypothetical protein